MKLRCDCCGVEQEFSSGEEASVAGWDGPPMFTNHVCCQLCPAVCVVSDAGHVMAHALWKKEGRPEFFSPETCADDRSIKKIMKVVGRQIIEQTKAALKGQDVTQQKKTLIDAVYQRKKSLN